MNLPISDKVLSVSSYNLILEHLADAIEAGNEPKVEALLAQHPDHAEELGRVMPALRALVSLSGPLTPRCNPGEMSTQT